MTSAERIPSGRTGLDHPVTCEDYSFTTADYINRRVVKEVLVKVD